MTRLYLLLRNTQTMELHGGDYFSARGSCCDCDGEILMSCIHAFNRFRDFKSKIWTQQEVDWIRGETAQQKGMHPYPPCFIRKRLPKSCTSEETKAPQPPESPKAPKGSFPKSGDLTINHKVL